MHHAARRREVPASGPRHHDHRRHLIAPSARRGSLLPVSHHCRPGACKRRSRAAEHAKIGARTAAAAKIHRGSSICRRLRRPALPAPRSLPHQIPIDGKPSAEPPRVPSLKAFGHRPSAPDDRSSNGPVSETLHNLRRPPAAAARPECAGSRPPPDLPQASAFGPAIAWRRFGRLRSFGAIPQITNPCLREASASPSRDPLASLC